MFFGPKHNLIMPGLAFNMSDGWETKRRRGPGHDWTIIKLGTTGQVKRLEVDTSHFKGNFPESCSLEGCEASPAATANMDAFLAAPHAWRELLPRTKLKANCAHVFRGLADANPVTHVRFNIYPDGGVSRLRLFGKTVPSVASMGGISSFNQRSKTQARKALGDCCGNVS